QGRVGRVRRRDGAGRDPGGTAPRDCGDHARRGRGAGPRARRARGRGGEGDVRDDRALMIRRALGIALIVLVLATLAGCGDGNGTPTLQVSAAASLKNAFEDYGSSFKDADVSYSFAGSD